MKNYTKGCVGCRSYHTCLMREEDYANIIDCPCIICLIKSMCATPCEEYENLYDEFTDN